MEERKIVGPFEGSKPRQVLISKEEWEQTKRQQGASDAPSSVEIEADEYAAALAMSEAADAAEAAQSEGYDGEGDAPF